MDEKNWHWRFEPSTAKLWWTWAKLAKLDDEPPKQANLCHYLPYLASRWCRARKEARLDTKMSEHVTGNCESRLSSDERKHQNPRAIIVNNLEIIILLIFILEM